MFCCLLRKGVPVQVFNSSIETWLWDFGDTIDLILDEYVWIGDDRPPVDRKVELH